VRSQAAVRTTSLSAICAFARGTLDSDSGKSAFNMGTASNVILDHCSIEYGQFDSIDAVGPVNITVSNSIIAFPIG
jgi:hypothetical protein